MTSQSARPDPLPNLPLMDCAKETVEAVPAIMRLIRHAVRETGDLSYPQVRALACISLNPGGSVSEISAALDVTPPTASALIDRLVKKSLVSRKEDPAERRKTILTLTTQGKIHLEEARSRAQMAVAHALGAGTPEQLLKIKEGLALLADVARVREERDAKDHSVDD